METVLKIVLVIVGIVNGYSVIAAFSPRTLKSLYGLVVNDASLVILLRHRAILFGLLGSFLISSAFDKNLYFYAVVAGLVSMIAYVLIGFSATNYTTEIRRVIIIDIIASVLLCITYVLYLFIK